MVSDNVHCVSGGVLLMRVVAMAMIIWTIFLVGEVIIITDTVRSGSGRAVAMSMVMGRFF